MSTWSTPEQNDADFAASASQELADVLRQIENLREEKSPLMLIVRGGEGYAAPGLTPRNRESAWKRVAEINTQLRELRENKRELKCIIYGYGSEVKEEDGPR